MSDQTVPRQGEGVEEEDQIDRRAWVRYPSNQDISFQPVAGGSGVIWSGKVQNISTGGIGLLLDRRFEPGTLLALTLQRKTESCSRAVLVRVVHDTLVTAHPGLRWLVGCAFVHKLTDDDLHALL